MLTHFGWNEHFEDLHWADNFLKFLSGIGDHKQRQWSMPLDFVYSSINRHVGHIMRQGKATASRFSLGGDIFAMVGDGADMRHE